MPDIPHRVPVPGRQASEPPAPGPPPGAGPPGRPTPVQEIPWPARLLLSRAAATTAMAAIVTVLAVHAVG
jgi:hypothetical protein